MANTNDDERYLIEGKLSRGLWRFAAPYMFAYLLQALYGAVDLFVVGKFCDAAAVAATATGAQLLHSLTGLILGLSAGGTVLIGFSVGAKDAKGAANAIGSTSTLFALVALIATPLLAFGTNFCVDLLQTPEEAVEFARQYVFVCACGVPFIIGYNVVGAIYRGLGDSKTPTKFVAFACVVNVIGDLILVAGFNMGPLGAAITTVASQALSFGYALVHMRRRRFSFEYHRTNFILRRKAVYSIVKVGAPLALQDALTGFSFLVILAIVNSMGVMPSAGLGVAERVIGFILLPPVAFSMAVATSTAQNNGAKMPKRAFESLKLGTLYSLYFGLFFWALFQICPVAIASVFTNDPEVARQGALYLRSFTLDCVFVAFIFNINGYFCGLGKTLVVLAHNALSALGVRIPVSYFFSRGVDATLFNVGFAAPLASLLSILVCVGYFVWLRKKGRLGI